jgi:molybdopterin synthase sulfur carrier subunit
MSIKVLFFASLREQVGVDQLQVKAQNLGAVLSALRETLSDSAMQAVETDNVRIAVNQQLIEAELDLSLIDGDEVAFMPPVTGG